MARFFHLVGVFSLFGSCTARASLERPVQLVSAVDQQKYERLLRMTNNETLIALMPRMIFYSPREVPRYFQIDEYTNQFTGFHSFPPGAYREPNSFFPWANPGGLTGAENATTFKFVVFPLPKGEVRDDSEKVHWWKQMIPPAAFNSALVGSFKWTYPIGTIFGEVILVRNSRNEFFPIEVRVREKQSAGHGLGWDMESYKPFPTAEHLANRLYGMVAEDSPWSENAQVQALLRYLSSDRTPTRHVLNDGFAGRALATRYALFDWLPAVPEAVVAELLTTTPFRPSTGMNWLEKGSDVAANPTTQAAFHIVPRNTNLPFMHVDNDSCMGCHDTVQKHARSFSTTINGGDWYGFVRGSDAIFTFHFMAGNQSFRKDFVDAGILVNQEPPELIAARAAASAQRATPTVYRSTGTQQQFYNTGRRRGRR